VKYIYHGHVLWRMFDTKVMYCECLAMYTCLMCANSVICVSFLRIGGQWGVIVWLFS
jgi:hypothetical protein